MTNIFNDETCGVFGSIPDPGRPGLLRFVVGEDTAPVEVDPQSADQELGDSFARLLLLQGNFPATADELLAAIDAATSQSDPLRKQKSFLLGEGSQLPASASIGVADRNLRFLVSRGEGPEGPDLILSAAHPLDGLVEVMAWDQRNLGFNYYRNIAGERAWVFAGNSRHALFEPTRGRGPFETHTSGALVMKELRIPWLHWSSFRARIFADVFPAEDVRRSHRWFSQPEFAGADVCETQVVMPSIRRWIDARFELITDTDGNITDPQRVVEQVLTSPTVNLITSQTASLVTSDVLDLPQSFFVDSEGLMEVIGLTSPPPFAVAGDLYRSSLQQHGFALRANGFQQPGDTHFAFVVPERAFEDSQVIRKAIDVGLISDRLAAALLMVDFANPVFSERRAALLRHTPPTARVTAGASTFSEEMANTMLAAADGTPEGSPEREFAERWNAGEENWRQTFDEILGVYFSAVSSKLSTSEGFDAYVRLAESRRQQVAEFTPLVESGLLFPTTSIPAANRSMRPDGTVAEVV